MIMFRILRTATKLSHNRSFKNFGHKRQPVPGITTLWHGFLTFTFIGLGLEWKWLKQLMLGAVPAIEEIDFEEQIESS